MGEKRGGIQIKHIYLNQLKICASIDAKGVQDKSNSYGFMVDSSQLTLINSIWVSNTIGPTMLKKQLYGVQGFPTFSPSTYLSGTIWVGFQTPTKGVIVRLTPISWLIIYPTLSSSY